MDLSRSHNERMLGPQLPGLTRRDDQTSFRLSPWRAVSDRLLLLQRILDVRPDFCVEFIVDLLNDR